MEGKLIGRIEAEDCNCQGHDEGRPYHHIGRGNCQCGPENENLLIEGIEKLTQDKAVIMIAHRLKTIRNADGIPVVEGGKTSSRGKQEELMAQQGLYRDFIEQRKESIGCKIA